LLKPRLILCLGNEIVSDDRFGYEIAKRLLEQGDLPDDVEVQFAAVAGFHLLQLLVDRRKVLIVDTIRTEQVAAGTLHSFPAGVFTPSKHLTTSHQISLPTALELGRQLELEMPSLVDVLAVEAADLETLSEQMTPPVQAAVGDALGFIKEWIIQDKMEENHDRKNICTVADWQTQDLS
jgi:hydrogenase maturation protease